MGTVIPGMPASVRASGLLHGNDTDFVTNAYLALQRQWPDHGGFAHYLYVLRQPGASRAQVLREIAASDNARACGVEFIDDLPGEHTFRPEEHDPARLLATTVSLRVSRTAADVSDLRSAVHRLTAEQLAAAVEGLVLAQQAHQGLLESRLNRVEARLEAAPAPSSHTPAPAAWEHLAAQQMLLAQQIDEVRSAVGAVRVELAGLREAFDGLHHYATVGLKREVADYVNALQAVQRVHATAAQAPAPTRTPAPSPIPRAPTRATPARTAANRAAARAEAESTYD